MNTVLITGASSGLGRELVRLFAQQDDNLILVARNREKLHRLKEEISSVSLSRVWVIEADLSRPETPNEIYEYVRAKNLMVDVLVNNAGFGVYGEFLDSDFTKIAQMYQVNVLSAIHLTRLFLPSMLDGRKGHLVNVSSLGAFFPGPLMANYFAAKADLLSFTKALSFEIKGSPVKITAVCPGPFKSGFQQTTFSHKRNLKEECRLPSPQKIAREVFHGILQKRPLVIPGITNRVIYWLSRFFPEQFVLQCVFQSHRRIRHSSF